MPTNNTTPGRSTWSSSTNYILVMIGAIVGIGNIFQFPFLVTKYGGLFLLFYIICEILISIPLLLGELLLGHLGRQNPVGSISIVCLLSNASQRWRNVGWITFIVAFLSLSYYLAAVAFPLQYFIATSSALYGQGFSTTHSMSLHGSLASNFYLLEFSFFLLLIATLIVIARGINRGLEGISRVTVPTYFIILVIIAIYTCTRGHFANSLTALFAIKPDQTTLTVLFAAMSFAIFKLGVGMGSMIVYGSYLPFSASFGKSTVIIVISDMLISLLAYFIIYPLMLESNPSQFINNLTQYNVIYIFPNISGGLIIALFLFLAAVIAAWTATIAMAETATVTLIERFNISRLRATWMVGLGALIVGTFAVLTHTQWIDVILFGEVPIRGILRNITSNIFTPISAFFIALVIGWVLKQDISKLELHFNHWLFSIWLFIVRYLAPIFILAVLVGAVLITIVNISF